MEFCTLRKPGEKKFCAAENQTETANTLMGCIEYAGEEDVQ